MLLEKRRGQLLIAPGRMKRLAKAKMTQLWMCLVVKVKFNVVKNNIAQKPGMLDS